MDNPEKLATGGDDQGIGEVSNENSWRKVNTFLAEIISALTFLI
jgi:hypothetical protein